MSLIAMAWVLDAIHTGALDDADYDMVKVMLHGANTADNAGRFYSLETSEWFQIPLDRDPADIAAIGGGWLPDV